MTPDYPSNGDGDALRRVAANGNDMTAPMVIDFPVVFPDEESAQQFAALATASGYQVQVRDHEEDAEWDAVCARTMVPIYEEIVRIQQELTTLAEPYRGYSDGWGTFGNKCRGAQATD